MALFKEQKGAAHPPYLSCMHNDALPRCFTVLGIKYGYSLMDRIGSRAGRTQLLADALPSSLLFPWLLHKGEQAAF